MLEIWEGKRQALLTTATMTPHTYTAHDPELPLQLQGRARVRYRNVWIRRLKGYDQGAKVN